MVALEPSPKIVSCRQLARCWGDLSRAKSNYVSTKCQIVKDRMLEVWCGEI